MRLLFPALMLACPAAPAQWVQLPDFPGTPRDDAAAFLANGRVYVGTGMEVGWGLTNDWYAYSPITASWEQVSSLPASGRQYCSGFRLDIDHGYLFGGLDANGPLNELWSYDPLTNTWTQRAPLPGPGRYACAVLVSDVHAYICGGMLAGGIPTNEVWRYDRITDSWTPRNPMPGPARHRAASMYHQVIGGADGLFQALDDVLAYDVSADAWSARPALPAPRFGCGAAEPMLICGASSLSEYHSTVFLLDQDPGTWSSTAIPAFPGGPRKGGVACTDVGSDLNTHFFGLGIDGTTRFNDWWMYLRSTGVAEHGTGTTTVHPNPASTHIQAVWPSHWAAARHVVLDATGRVLLHGNRTGAMPLDVHGLSAGRYELILEHGDERLRAPFVKVP